MSQENGSSAGSSLWVTGQEQTGLSSGISRVLTTELTAVNSSHLQAGRYVAILWRRTGGMQKRRLGGKPSRSKGSMYGLSR